MLGPAMTASFLWAISLEHQGVERSVAGDGRARRRADGARVAYNVAPRERRSGSVQRSVAARGTRCVCRVIGMPWPEVATKRLNGLVGRDGGRRNTARRQAEWS